MSDYNRDARTVERGGGSGRMIAIGVAVVLGVVLLLFATGFWRADVTKEGSLPKVDVSAKGGSLPQVDLESKKVVVGTKSTSIAVPKVTTKQESVSVPVVGVTDGK
jgi:hypothetical protein